MGGCGFFGSSTPSAKIPVKPNTQKAHQRNRGGKVGHEGMAGQVFARKIQTKWRKSVLMAYIALISEVPTKIQMPCSVSSRKTQILRQ
jgi:hypothetical protein